MKNVVVLGGGIAGFQCVQELCRLCPTTTVALVSNSTKIKGVNNVRKLSSNVEEFEVVELELDAQPYPNLHTVRDTAVSLDTEHKSVLLSDGSRLPYDKLCICTGAVPKAVADHPLVLVLRDQDTVQDLSERLQTARRVILVGNGGIALELAHSLHGIEVVWVLKHSHIGDAFFDIDAASFLRTELEQGRKESPQLEDRQHGPRLPSNPASHIGMHRGRPAFGHAVGPQWVNMLPLGSRDSNLVIEADCEVSSVASGSGQDAEVWPLAVALTNGRVHGADFVISAIGVAPNTGWLQGVLPLADGDGGILVDRRMETGVKDVFAAGDVCCLRETDREAHWFQMRLWTQARVMGVHAAHCMAGTEETVGIGLQLELFTHVTRFLGKKVVLLGLYNGQGIPDSQSDALISYCRSSEGENSTFVRVLLLRGRMVGAVLIGETDLEEAFENLILDGLDLSSYGPALLDPELEIDHIFD